MRKMKGIWARAWENTRDISPFFVGVPLVKSDEERKQGNTGQYTADCTELHL
jgi:hypothetical protein